MSTEPGDPHLCACLNSGQDPRTVYAGASQPKALAKWHSQAFLHPEPCAWASGAGCCNSLFWRMLEHIHCKQQVKDTLQPCNN